MMHQAVRCPGLWIKVTGRQSLLSPVVGLWTRGAATTPSSSSPPAPAEHAEVDKLYRLLEVEVRGHDRAVLDSYQTFSTTAARELDIPVFKTWEDWRTIEKRTLLASVFVKKKNRVQYENRTYYRVMQFKQLTGSTADTFLEYIQRNLPEGVSMRVARHQLHVIPEHLKPPPKTETDVTQ